MYNTKNYVLMRDIITKHHPKFIESDQVRKVGLENPEAFNIEFLIEQTLAYVGGYDFVDAAGYDFNDSCKSDSKTTSVNVKTRKVEINHVENKIGALRITIFNPIKDEVDFMFIPAYHVNNISKACFGTSQFQRRVMMTWNNKQDHYNMFDKFRMPTFKDMAKATHQDWVKRKFGRIPN
jgi:hypothetical protein